MLGLIGVEVVGQGAEAGSETIGHGLWERGEDSEARVRICTVIGEAIPATISKKKGLPKQHAPSNSHSVCPA